jgi:hypothetical protein
MRVHPIFKLVGFFLVLSASAVFLSAAQDQQAATPGTQGNQKPTIGMQYRATLNGNGVEIIHVYRGSPAEQAGLRAKDLVISLNGKPVNQREDMNFSAFKPGTVVTLGYQRTGENKQAMVTLLRHDQVYSKDVFLPLAEKGDADAQADLAGLYLGGEGIAKDYAVAVLWYRKAAEQGNSEAERHLAGLYEFGDGLPLDYSQALFWYRKAVEQGNDEAEWHLAGMYEFGKGLPQDNAQAVNWYRKAAEHGNSDAEVTLGWLYENGRCVPQDKNIAVSWYRKAAEQGNVFGENNLGMMYEQGVGVPQDFGQALSWYRKAAEQGDNNGEWNVARMYILGRGMRKSNFNEAAVWVRKAAEQGNVSAQTELATLYSGGLGVKKDLSQMDYWNNKAAKKKAEDAAEAFQGFQKQAAAWRALAAKPELPEDARKQRTLAESYLREKDFKGAIQHYESGVDLCPTWPEGWYNLALLYGETEEFAKASDRMKHYLELMPNSPDTQAAKDKIVIWEDKEANQPRVRP